MQQAVRPPHQAASARQHGAGSAAQALLAAHRRIAGRHAPMPRCRQLSCAASAAPTTATATNATRPGTPGLDREQLKQLSKEYTLQMRDAMGWPKDKCFDYSMERGLYFHEVLPGLICGSQPRHAKDVEDLHALGVGHVLSLQQDKDMHYWGVQPEVISQRCAQLGIEHIRRPVRDFDPHSLRKVLPSAVQALHRAHSTGDKVYVHCTAGLGRAPGVIIAYMYWFYDLSLDEAYELLTSIRPCGPKKEAVRGATHDLWHPNHLEGLERHPPNAFTRLSAQDRRVLQGKVVQGHFHHH